MSRVNPPPSAIDGLNPDDPGVRLLAEAVRGRDPAKVLLVHSGDLPGLGPGATRLVLDVREREDSRATPIDDDGGPLDHLPAFETAIVWPRAHLGKDFTRACLARGAASLAPGGVLFCAVRKQKGAEGVADFMAALLGDVRVVKRDRGYRLLQAVRTDAVDTALMTEALSCRYTIVDPRLGSLRLSAMPGVFSRRGLDAGTACLLDHLARLDPTPATAVDLGCGIGALALWAARRWPTLEILAVDSNVRAVACATANAAAAGLDDRVRVILSDGVPHPDTLDPPWSTRAGRLELGLVNPPTHADPHTLDRLLGGFARWLAPNAPAYAVVSRPGRALEAFHRAGARTYAHRYDHYTVIEARF